MNERAPAFELNGRSVENERFFRDLKKGALRPGTKALAILEYSGCAFDATSWDTPENARDRVAFWDANVPDGIMGADTDPAVRRLLMGNPPFLAAMRDILSADQWESALRDPEAAAHFSRFELASRPEYVGSAEAFEAFAARTEIPVVAVEGAEVLGTELRDVIVATGLEPMMRAVASGLRAVLLRDGKAATGRYHFDTLEISVGAVGTGRRGLVPLLFHETGHGVQERLAWSEAGRAVFARFAVAAAMEPQTHSSYAEAHRLRGNGDVTEYVAESFAEDFRLYFFAPERLPELKRAVFERAVSGLFPAVDSEDVRGRVRRVLGSYYGIAVKDVVVPTRCENARRIARRLDRVDAEKQH